MSEQLPFTMADIERLPLSKPLRNVLMLALHLRNGVSYTLDGGTEGNGVLNLKEESPATIEIDGQEYVVDDDEVSVVYHDDDATTCAIYVRPELTRWTKWANADGHDCVTEDLVYSGDRSRDLDALREFNGTVTD